MYREPGLRDEAPEWVSKADAATPAMLRFAAAVLAAAAIRPTPAEKGLARLSEALASPAVVNNDVLWARCGALDNMAPHSAMLLHSDRGGACLLYTSPSPRDS